MSAVVTGKVIRFDEIRGYGFVAPDSGTEDVFLHVNDLAFDKRLLTPGMRVRFIAEEGDRGLKASRVEAVEPEVPDSSVARSSGENTVDDDLCDILTADELVSELTELLVTSVPAITAEHIVKVRECVLTVARVHGWIED